MKNVDRKIVVIGAGNMGASLIKGLLREGFAVNNELAVYDVHEERLEAFSEHGVQGLSQLSQLSGEAATYLLCVKPHDLLKLSDELAPHLHADSLVISILAGTTTLDLARRLSFEGSIVRAMPNIAATIACAASVVCSNSELNPEEKKVVEAIFSAVGEVYWCKESLMDAVTGLSGSGPAYIYMVIEALADGGLKMGIPKDLALKLATQTVLGAASMVKSSGLHPALLKDQVTTPAGTTISALHELEERGLRSMFVSAVVKATERSKDLGAKSSEVEPRAGTKA